MGRHWYLEMERSIVGEEIKKQGKASDEDREVIRSTKGRPEHFHGERFL